MMSRRQSDLRTFNLFYQAGDVKPAIIPLSLLKFRFQIGLTGPGDEFGFRNAHTYLDLRRRPSSSKLCVILGGSAAYGVSVHHEETFGQRLEAAISRRMPAGETFRVLNYAAPGNDIVTDLLTMTMLVHALRPEVVIWHSGFNDLLWGESVDRPLIEGYALTKIVNNLNLPKTVDRRTVVDAILMRLEQMHAYAVACGARLIWGLPPLSAMKPLSAVERRRIGAFEARQGPAGLANWDFTAHYDLLRERFEASTLAEKVAFLDFEAPIAALGTDRTVFADPVHLAPEGEQEVASAYTRSLLEHFGLE
jgi:lysophospholipase L1-like esterase